MKRKALCAVGLAFAMTASECAHAGGKSAAFDVRITLQAAAAQGCRHRTSQSASDALLTVTCAPGQFVDITPVRDRAQWRSFGGPMRLRFASVADDTPAVAEVERDGDTVTSLRVAWVAGGIEMLVSF